MQNARSQRALLGIFIFVMTIFFILAYRQEVQARGLKTATYNMCLARNINLDRQNRYLDGMIDIEEHNPFKTTSPETIARRIALFKAAKLTPIDCEPVR